MKKILAIALSLALIISLSVSFLVSADKADIKNWSVYCSQYDAQNMLLDDDTDFTYEVTSEGAIKIDGPQAAGWWPCILAVKNDKVTLAGTKLVYISPIPDLGWGGNINIAFLTEKFTNLPGVTMDQGMTEPVAQQLSANAKGFQIILRGDQVAASTKVGNLEIQFFGYGELENISVPIDFPVNIDTTIEIKADATLGFIISYNGTEIKDKDGKGIDLTILKDLTEGYLSVGAFAPGTIIAGITLKTLNGTAVESPAAATSSAAASSQATSSAATSSKAAEKSGCGNKAK